MKGYAAEDLAARAEELVPGLGVLAGALVVLAGEVAGAGAGAGSLDESERVVAAGGRDAVFGAVGVLLAGVHPGLVAAGPGEASVAGPGEASVAGRNTELLRAAFADMAALVVRAASGGTWLWLADPRLGRPPVEVELRAELPAAAPGGFRFGRPWHAKHVSAFTFGGSSLARPLCDCPRSDGSPRGRCGASKGKKGHRHQCGQRDGGHAANCGSCAHRNPFPGWSGRAPWAHGSRVAG